MSTTSLGSKSLSILSDSSPMDCYVAKATNSAARPWVIVAMELFGVNDHIRDIADRLSAQGYNAIAPNFYHRTLPGASFPFSEDGRKQGFEHLHMLKRHGVVNDVDAVMNWIRAQSEQRTTVAFLGFSLGGHIAYLASTQFAIAACACFYGGWITSNDIPLSQPDATITLTPGIAAHNGRIIYFAGGRDHVISREQLDQLSLALIAAHANHEIVIYPEAQHGFFCEMRETFHRSSRDDAWTRVLSLFAEALGQEDIPRNAIAGPGA